MHFGATLTDSLKVFSRDKDLRDEIEYLSSLNEARLEN